MNVGGCPVTKRWCLHAQSVRVWSTVERSARPGTGRMGISWDVFRLLTEFWEKVRRPLVSHKSSLTEPPSVQLAFAQLYVSLKNIILPTPGQTLYTSILSLANSELKCIVLNVDLLTPKVSFHFPFGVYFSTSLHLKPLTVLWMG